MKINKIWCAFFSATVLFTACEVEDSYLAKRDSKESALIYIAKSSGNDQDLTIFPYTDEARQFTFGASFGAVGLPASAINVQFEQDNRAFDSVNVVRQAQGLPAYRKFPADAFTLESLNAVIPSGKTSSNLITLKYFPKKFDSKTDYLLPISIKSADGYTINASKKTVFIIAPKLSDVLVTKTAWAVTASTEERTGEGPINGRAAVTADNDLNTFWHSSWSSGEPPYPHWLSIDMKAEIFVTKVAMAPRQNNSNGFTKFKIEGSVDGTTWKSLLENQVFDPAKRDGTFQEFPIIPQYLKFVKITMLEGKVKSTHLGEINIYRY